MMDRYISTTLGSHHHPSSYRHRVELLVDAPLAELEGYAPWVTLEAVDGTRTRMVSGTDDPARSAEWLLRLEHPFRVVGDEAVRAALEAMRGRLEGALRA